MSSKTWVIGLDINLLEPFKNVEISVQVFSWSLSLPRTDNPNVWNALESLCKSAVSVWWLGHKPCTGSLYKTDPVHSQTSINLQIFTETVSFSYLWSNSALEQGWLIPAMSKPFTQTIKLMYCEKQGLKSLFMTLKSCRCHSWCDLELKVYSKINQTKQSFWREIKCQLVFSSCAVHFPDLE